MNQKQSSILNTLVRIEEFLDRQAALASLQQSSKRQSGVTHFWRRSRVSHLRQTREGCHEARGRAAAQAHPRLISTQRRPGSGCSRTATPTSSSCPV